MAIINNEHQITKISVGDKIIMDTTKSDGWIKLDHADNLITDSLILFRDNGDGTASITGGIKFSGDTDNSITVVNPPDGYNFTGAKNDNVPFNFEKSSGPRKAKTSIVNGKLVVTPVDSMNYSWDDWNTILSLSAYSVDCPSFNGIHPYLTVNISKL
ncbi:hypothetical protein FC56_GL000300 [Lentilactobacillus senioris DSM 24302 = JCM 17472]|uniref:Uncharacterized protein n=1 Tax=Lentilactobacillus senioris DSM 24302 = JCM 17472 TaxID=1423802 RepID=A0A0R2CRG0_9LACO|nr:hypothetical protein [Lentilactobacillus senioris]KRM93586.1 hypothetical protein FC56_GL000300 [Lentilactobacillus senioris DSM 24302 = JCM 17472]